MVDVVHQANGARGALKSGVSGTDYELECELKRAPKLVVCP